MRAETTPDVPAAATRHNLIRHTFWTDREVSLWGCLGKRGATAGLGCLAGCSSHHQQSLQPARSPTLNSFPILYSLPADNKLSIRSPAEHLQLSSLSRTSAWPRVSGSIPNCSHTSHLQLFCRQNGPDLRAELGN